MPMAGHGVAVGDRGRRTRPKDLRPTTRAGHLVMTARHMGYNVLAGSEVGTGVSSLQHGRPIEAFEPWPQVRACEL